MSEFKSTEKEANLRLAGKESTSLKVILVVGKGSAITLPLNVKTFAI